MTNAAYYTALGAGLVTMVVAVVAAVLRDPVIGTVAAVAAGLTLVAMGVDCWQLDDHYEVGSMTIKMRWYDYTIPALVGFPVAWALYVHGRYHINRAEAGASNQPAATPGIQ